MNDVMIQVSSDYIYAAYGVAAVVISGLCIASLNAYHKTKRILDRAQDSGDET